ncbi:Coiled-coil domain-containing protein 132 [Papilio xuthus]|uniref:Coiled-coil domain-containing protein 132 n=1 Tax=Papilio xuthus TaxID=66420 RepID=A0A194Q7A6_PAPXU|nr:Coiled-coil domain-containing protein 132 [Papilio xuthus]
MLGDEVEKRHDPPGVNSRSLSVAHTAADLEVLREIENVYFSSPSEFDAARYVLSHAPSPPTCEAVELMFTKLKRQQQVVSGKALHLISQQRDNCDREFAEIQNIRQQLTVTLEICRKARENLSIASNNLTISTFIILANSDATSSVHSQDDSIYISKYFKNKTKDTPFDIFRDDNITNDDIFGIETELEQSDSDDEPDELKSDYIDDDKEINDKITNCKDNIIVTNTTLAVLRNCGQYLQICRYLPQISLDVIMLMYQLFDYYMYTVHLFFTSDLEVASSTLYTPKLTSTLKRITNNINTEQDESKCILSPELPQHLDMNTESTLHGLSERIVAVESVIFLAKQYECLHSYLNILVIQHQRMILEHFKDNNLAVAVDLRMPVYMCSAAKAVDARTSLIAMSQVKWDVKNVAVEHSPYVDMIVRNIQVFALRLENISNKVSLNRDVLNAIWSMVSKFIVHLLVEGFSNATKCTNGGRGLMQLDYRQLFVKLEKISGLKPIPYQDYVDRYVKAYYLPRKGLEEFIQERLEYSNKHLLTLVTCACENKRDRQALTALIEGRELS